MATRTLLNPSVQISSSTAYSTTTSPGVALQTGALSIQDDLNGLRSQVQLLLDASGQGHWYDDLSTSTTGQKRGVKQLNAGLSTIESKAIIATASLQTSITVPTGQNYVVLNVANGQAPTQAAAVLSTTFGTVVAQSAASGASFAANELTQVTGANPQAPKNRVSIVDGSTENVLQTQDRDIYGLLQFEGSGTDGAAFNDTVSGARVKISFVYFSTTSNSFVAVPAADIQGKSFRYLYPFRTTLAALSEDAFLNPSYVDNTSPIDITLSRATANQAGAGIAVNTDVLWRVGTSANFKVQNSSGSKDLFAISPGASSNAGVVSTDTFAFNTTSAITSIKGATLATGGQAINVGVATGQVDTTGPLTFRSYGFNPLALNSGGTMTFTDGYEAASTWTSPSIALSSSSSDWSAYKAAYGEASLLSGVLKAGQMGNHAVYVANVTAATIPAGTTVTGAGSGANISIAFPDNSATPRPATNTQVFVNGVWMTPGDDYVLVAGSTTTDLQFTFALRGGTQPDKIKLQIFGNPAIQN